MRTLGKLPQNWFTPLKSIKKHTAHFTLIKHFWHATINLWTKGLHLLFLLTSYPTILCCGSGVTSKTCGPKRGSTYSISFFLPHFFPCALSFSFSFSSYNSLAFDRKMSNLSVFPQLYSFPAHLQFSLQCLAHLLRLVPNLLVVI